MNKCVVLEEKEDRRGLLKVMRIGGPSLRTTVRGSNARCAPDSDG